MLLRMPQSPALSEMYTAYDKRKYQFVDFEDNDQTAVFQHKTTGERFTLPVVLDESASNLSNRVGTAYKNKQV